MGRNAKGEIVEAVWYIEQDGRVSFDDVHELEDFADLHARSKGDVLSEIAKKPRGIRQRTRDLYEEIQDLRRRTRNPNLSAGAIAARFMADGWPVGDEPVDKKTKQPSLAAAEWQVRRAIKKFEGQRKP